MLFEKRLGLIQVTVLLVMPKLLKNVTRWCEWTKCKWFKLVPCALPIFLFEYHAILHLNTLFFMLVLTRLLFASILLCNIICICKKIEYQWFETLHCCCCICFCLHISLLKCICLSSCCSLHLPQLSYDLCVAH